MLKEFGHDQSQIAAEVKQVAPVGDEPPASHELPLSLRCKRIIESAMKEAIALDHHYVGTEHLLMGMVDHSDCRGAQVLLNLGASLIEIRGEVLEILGYADR